MPTTHEGQWEQRSGYAASDRDQTAPGDGESTRPADSQGGDDNPIRRRDAEDMVRRAMWFGGAAGVLPLPLLDLALISGVQIKLIADLSALYDVPFSEHAVKSSVAALVGGVIPVSGISSGSASMIKAIPVIGPLMGLAVAPAFAAATTWAIGRTFISHFESGGTLLTFDVGKARKQFRESFESSPSRR